MNHKRPQGNFRLDLTLRCPDPALVIVAARTVIEWADGVGILEKVSPPASERGEMLVYNTTYPEGTVFRGKIHRRVVRLQNMNSDIVNEARNLSLPLSVDVQLSQVSEWEERDAARTTS